MSCSSRNCPYYRCSVHHKPGNNYTNLIHAESPCLPATRSASKCVLSLSFILRKRSKGNKKTQPVCLGPCTTEGITATDESSVDSIRFRLAARTDGRFTLARHPAARVCCVFERGWTIQPEEGSKGKQASKQKSSKGKKSETQIRWPVMMMW